MPKLKPHWPTLLLALAVATGASAWLWWSSTRNPDVRFLPRHAGALWILGQKSIVASVIGTDEVRAEFRREFDLEQIPKQASLSVCGFYGHRVSINGQPVGEDQPLVADSTVSRDWKTPHCSDVASYLRTGKNEISVVVANRRGPPSLWLRLDAGSVEIGTDESWQVSVAEGYWHQAFAAQGEHPYGPSQGRQHTTFESLRRSAGQIGVMALIAGAIVGVVFFRARRKPAPRPRSNRQQAATWRDWLTVPNALIALGALLWCLLFWNNSRALPARIGFDCREHLEYVRFIQTNHRLPLPDEGWEMFQPPLYYLSSALILGARTGPLTIDDVVATLRYFNLLGGLVQITFLYLGLRCLLPDRPWEQAAGWLVGTFLPAQLTIFQFTSNEGWSAALSTVALYCAVRVLETPATQTAPRVALGVSLAAALLTKSTSLVVLGVIFIVLIGRLFVDRQRHAKIWLRELAVPALLILALAGWHFARVWSHHGRPIVGNWEEDVGNPWWQEPGYVTARYFLSFGESLRQPYFSAANGFADAIYATLWGDGLCGGKNDFAARAPWNIDLMSVGYLFALLPTLLILVGAGVMLWRLLSRPTATDFLLWGLAFALSLAVVSLAFQAPYLTTAKAFYALPASLCLAVFAGRGFGALTLSSSWSRAALLALLTLWAINSFVSFWIISPSANVERALGYDLSGNGQTADALQHFEQGLAYSPDDPELRAAAAGARGVVAIEQGDERAAIAALNEAQRLWPDWPDINGLLAELLLNGPIEQRDVPRAVRLAEEACQKSEGRKHAFLRTLAAAYAEQEDYAKAIDTAQRAYRQAQLAGQPQAAQEMLKRLEVYRGLAQAHGDGERPNSPVIQKSP